MSTASETPAGPPQASSPAAPQAQLSATAPGTPSPPGLERAAVTTIEKSHSDRTQQGVSYLYLLAAFVIVTAGVRMAQEILQLLLLSVFLAVVGVPVYAWLVKQKIASWLSLMIVISGLILSTLLVFWIVMTSLADFTSRQEHYAEQLRERTKPLQVLLEKLIPEEPAATEPVAAEQTAPKSNQPLEEPGIVSPATPLDSSSAAEVTEKLATAIDDVKTDVARETSPESPALAELTPILAPDADQNAGWLQPRRITAPPQSRRSWRELIASQFDPARVIAMAANIALSISQILSNTMLIILTVVFILLEASTFPRKLKKAFGDHPQTQERYALIIEKIRSYLVIKTAMSLLTGALIAAWLWLFGVPYAGLWGMLAFLLNYIPNIGSIIAALPALMVAWLDLGLFVGIASGIGYLIVNMAIGNILEPRVLGRGMGLSALVVFCSMVFWGWALGPVGMLLSVPLTMAARVAFEGFDDTRWLGTLLGDSE